MGLVEPVADRPVVGRFLSLLGYDCVGLAGAWRIASEFSYPKRPLPIQPPEGRTSKALLSGVLEPRIVSRRRSCRYY